MRQSISGMNPYLEGPDFHNRLTAALADELGPQLPDCYRIGSMPPETPGPAGDDRTLVLRAVESPGALLSLRWEDAACAPEVDLVGIVNRLQHTARYNQEARYEEPELEDEVREWVGEGVAGLVAGR